MVESFASEIIMMWLLRLAPFAAMLALGCAVALLKEPRWRRGATVLFIALWLGTQTVAGLTQRDLWPFSPYPVIVESAARFREAVWYEVRVVDRSGAEMLVDASPLTRSVLEKWTERNFFTLDRQHQIAVASFLLSKPSCPSIAGPLAAPDWLLHAGPVSHAPTALRVYRHDLRQRALVFEYTAQ
jgi:hypothetical protein